MWKSVLSSLAPDVVHFCKVRADANIMNLIRNCGARNLHAAAAPFVDLAAAPSPAAFDQLFPAKDRKNRRRLLRRLEEKGTVEFEQATTPERAGYFVREAIAMKRRWLKEKGLHSSALFDTRTEQFFVDLAATRAVGRDGPGLHASALMFDGRPVSAMIAIPFRDRLAGHIFAYDVAHQRSGVGALLLEFCLRQAHGEGFTCYDLLAPADAYKLDWTKAQIPVTDWAVPFTFAGRLYVDVYLASVREGARTILPWVPPGLRKLLFARHAADAAAD
jgi:CelD/BcsL family acetyltransferase involved in cellulose biosynthesis